jgi:hypothetical protein
MRELSRRDALRLLTHAKMPWVCVPGAIKWLPINIRPAPWWHKGQYIEARQVEGDAPASSHGKLIMTVPNSWDGEKLFVTPDRDGFEITHELAHWLVATPDRRKRPEFRLGPAPWNDVERQDYSWLSGNTDEEMACIVQIAMYRALGLPWQDIANNLGYPEHSWTRLLHADIDNQTPGYWLRRARKRMGRHHLAWLKGFSL